MRSAPSCRWQSVARQQQHPDEGPATPQSGSPGGARTLLPPPANDNRGFSRARIVVALAAAVAFALGLMALQPFG